MGKDIIHFIINSNIEINENIHVVLQHYMDVRDSIVKQEIDHKDTIIFLDRMAVHKYPYNLPYIVKNSANNYICSLPFKYLFNKEYIFYTSKYIDKITNVDAVKLKYIHKSIKLEELSDVIQMKTGNVKNVFNYNNKFHVITPNMKDYNYLKSLNVNVYYPDVLKAISKQTIIDVDKRYIDITPEFYKSVRSDIMLKMFENNSHFSNLIQNKIKS